MDDWKNIRLPEDAELERKEWYTYRIAGTPYDIEVFETSTGQFYAIGTPNDKSTLIIYGSTMTDSAPAAIKQTIHKINRDQLHEDILTIGEDAPDA